MVIEFEVRGDYIALDKLLKATALVSSGGEAHVAVAAGAVTVGGQPETRKRAKLRPGQLVRFGDTEILLTAQRPAIEPPATLIGGAPIELE